MHLLPSKRTMTLIPPDAVSSAPRLRAAVVVAHPDDEILWCGGYVLAHPEFLWRIVTLCRATIQIALQSSAGSCSNWERVARWRISMTNPIRSRCQSSRFRTPILRLLAGSSYNLILTHGPKGEYTQHRRHEECCHAVVGLWQLDRIDTERLWLFAYEDGGHAYLPRVREDADRRDVLTDHLWLEKRRLIMDLYGYEADSWEARTAPREEGFHGASTQHRQRQSVRHSGSNNCESTHIERIPGTGGRLGAARRTVMQGPVRDGRGGPPGTSGIDPGKGMVLSLVPAGCHSGRWFLGSPSASGPAPTAVWDEKLCHGSWPMVISRNTAKC